MGNSVRFEPGERARFFGNVVPAPAKPVEVSVIVPCYNVERWIDECLTSIEANDRINLEIIVIDDGSKDDGLRIMREHEARDPRVHVVAKPNGGYGEGVNTGLLNAHGKYVTIVEPDDYVLPHCYDDLWDFARSFAIAPQVIKTPYLRVLDAGTDHERRVACGFYKRIKPAKQPFKLEDAPRLVRHHPSVWSALYLRGWLADKGIWMLEVPGAGWVDNPWLIATLAQATSIAYLDKPYYCYREDLPGSSSMTKTGELAITRWLQMQTMLEDLKVTDKGILSAHIARGFTYLGGIMEETSIEGTPVEKLVKMMFDRMDSDLVLACPEISNDRKEYYCQVQGIKGATWDRGAYTRTLLAAGVHQLRTTGLGPTFKRVGTILKRTANIKKNTP